MKRVNERAAGGEDPRRVTYFPNCLFLSLTFILQTEIIGERRPTVLVLVLVLVIVLSLSPQPEQVNLCISSEETAAKSSGSCCGSEDPREEEQWQLQCPCAP
jgi:hypothetical protein